MLSTCKLLCASLSLYSTMASLSVNSKDGHLTDGHVASKEDYLPTHSKEEHISSSDNDSPLMLYANSEDGPGISFNDYGNAYCIRVLKSFEMVSSGNACYGTVVDGSEIDYSHEDNWILSYDDDSIKLVYENEDTHKLGISFNHGSTEHGHTSLSLEMMVENYVWIGNSSKLVVEFAFDDCDDDSQNSHALTSAENSLPTRIVADSLDNEDVSKNDDLSEDTTDEVSVDEEHNQSSRNNSRVDATSQDDDDITVSIQSSGDSNSTSVESKDENDEHSGVNSHSNDGDSNGHSSNGSSGDSNGSSGSSNGDSNGSSNGSSGNDDSGESSVSGNDSGNDSESAHLNVQWKLAELFASFRSEVDCDDGNLEHLNSAVCDQTNGDSFKYAIVLDHFGDCTAVTSSDAMVLDGGHDSHDDDDGDDKDSASQKVFFGVFASLAMVFMLQ